ncbi:MAG: hypothetical protein ACREHD_06395, partial [Pirellulales bacterium]
AGGRAARTKLGSASNRSLVSPSLRLSLAPPPLVREGCLRSALCVRAQLRDFFAYGLLHSDWETTGRIEHCYEPDAANRADIRRTYAANVLMFGEYVL